MSKPAAAKKEAPRQKSVKDQKKELEDKLFGEKNKQKKKEIQGLIKKLDLALELEKKDRDQQEILKKSAVVKQIIPVGVDPKTVQCINFLNNNCTLGDECPFGHNIKKEAKKEIIEDAQDKPKIVCRFLIDAINNGEYTNNWACPFPNCKDYHKLLDVEGETKDKISIEEYIELRRQTIDDSKGTPVTEETFKEWKAKKDKEEEIHARKVAALSSSVKGVDLFKLRPEMFEDDDEAADDVNYNERNYEAYEEEEEAQPSLIEQE